METALVALGLAVSVALGVLLLVESCVALRARRRRRERHARDVARARARAHELAARLGWPTAADPRVDTVHALTGELDGLAVTLVIGCCERDDWARVELRGRAWLPDGYGLGPPRGSRDDLTARHDNFATADATALAVEPLAAFTDPDTPFTALAHNLGAGDTPDILPDLYTARATIGDVDDAIAWLRTSIARAQRWADATATWHARAGG